MKQYKPVGGRGQKAPYKTRVIRVPEPIADKVEILIENFRISLANNQDSELDEFIVISLSDLQKLSSDILRCKKSAKVSFEKLQDKLIRIYSLVRSL